MTFKSITRGWQGDQVSSFGNFRRNRKANNPATIATDSIEFLDAGNSLSYSGTGTTWTDLSSSAKNADLTNGPTYDTTNNGFIIFDGVNDSAIVTDPSAMKNQNFTVSVWVYPQTQNQALVAMIDFDHIQAGSILSQGWVVQSEDATTNQYYYLAYYTGSAFQPTGNIGAGKGVQVTTGVWQNLTYTKSGTSVIGYLNGVQRLTATAGSSTVSYLTSRNFAIGGSVKQSRPFKGNVSNVQIYSTALSSTEVIQNFDAMRARFGV
jgi:hypothetical protein